jgi:hypothetical protein
MDVLENELLNAEIMNDIRIDMKEAFSKLKLIRINKIISGMFFNKENHDVFPVIGGGDLWKKSIICNFGYKNEATPDGFIETTEKIFTKNFYKKRNKFIGTKVTICGKKTFCGNYKFDTILLIKLFASMIKPNVEIAFATLLRYIVVLDSGNNQAGISYNELKNISVELCASPINRSCTYFCSMFSDIDKYYKGYCGSIFDYNLISGNNYTANPPYEEIIMNRIAIRLSEQLNKTIGVHIVVTLPHYDTLLVSYEILKKFIVLEVKHDKDKYLYINHINGIQIPIINTLQLLLESKHSEESKS